MNDENNLESDMIMKLVLSMAVVLALIVHLDDGRGRAPGIGRCGAEAGHV